MTPKWILCQCIHPSYIWNDDYVQCPKTKLEKDVINVTLLNNFQHKLFFINDIRGCFLMFRDIYAHAICSIEFFFAGKKKISPEKSWNRRRKIHFYFIKLIFRRRNFTFHQQNFFSSLKIKFRQADGIGTNLICIFWKWQISLLTGHADNTSLQIIWGNFSLFCCDLLKAEPIETNFFLWEK